MLTAILAGSLLAATPTAHAAGCAIERGRYVATDGERFSLAFRDIGRRPGWISSLALGIRDERSGRTFWWLPDAGTAKVVSLISTTDVDRADWSPPSPDGGVRPLERLTYVALDGQERQVAGLPEAGSPAPRLIVLPELPEAMLRRPAGAVRLDDAVFRLVGCSSPRRRATRR